MVAASAVLSAWPAAAGPAGEERRAAGTLVFDAEVGGFGPHRSYVLVVHADGTGLRKLTPPRRIDAAPTWSPDGKRIAFLSGNRPTLWVMTADGSRRRELSRYEVHGGFDRAPRWSPHGRSIAFVRSSPIVGGAVRGKTTIWVVSPDGVRVHAVTKGADLRTDRADSDYVPTWSPDGRSIAFERLGKLWVARADGSSPHAITRRPYEIGGSAAWSPDGARIAYAHCVVGLPPDAACGRIAVIGVAGRRERLVTESKTDELPAWSPDGTSIAFVHGLDLQAGELHLVRLDSGRETRVAVIDGATNSVGWQPVSR